MCLHARSPNAAESKELVRWLKRPRNAVQMRRGQLVSLSAQGMRVQEISDTLPLHEECVRSAVQPMVVAQADRLPGGTTDDSQGLACDHRGNSGPA